VEVVITTLYQARYCRRRSSSMASSKLWTLCEPQLRKKRNLPTKS